MYRVSGKQLTLLAICSALLAGVIVALAQRAMERRETSRLSIEPVAIAEPTVATDEQNNIEIYHALSPGVVNITNRGYQESLFGAYPSEGSGSGSIIDERGYILTNYHVIQGATQLEVQVENDKYAGALVGTDRDNDLAVIKIDPPRDKRLTVVKLGTSQGLQVGQKVLAIGNPFGLQRTLTTGIISGLERPLRDPAARRTINGAIQTDAAINPGNSGGPLLNARGEMIGINTAIQANAGGGSIGIGFAVPVDIAKKIVPDLISKGYVTRPWLGVTTMPLNRRIARSLDLPVEEGIIVGDVYRGSGAAEAGLRGAIVRESIFGGITLQQIGDVILTIEGRKTANTDDLQAALQDKKPGQTVQVELLRQGRRVTVPVRLSERPPEER
ncbi:MAG TPA: trypsin-like peptidase domain-containing protein [Blastocatellia bacterium]|jgi:S1-C subfamily serine protease|nr:trypsin-like peptidase domain-containing protein [Blastocatellia bacterium]